MAAARLIEHPIRPRVALVLVSVVVYKCRGRSNRIYADQSEVTEAGALLVIVPGG